MSKGTGKRGFRGGKAGRPTPHAICEPSEIDHGMLDIVLADQTGLPVGRPILMVAMDSATRLVAAAELRFKARRP